MICYCNKLNEKEIRETVDMHPSIDVFSIHNVLKCQVGCGQCMPQINEIIEENRRK